MSSHRDRARCALCGRAVLTVVMDNGKRVFVDPKPDASGSVCVLRNMATGEIEAWHRRQQDSALTYRVHSATCPQAALFGTR